MKWYRRLWPAAAHPRTMIHARLVKGAGADSGQKGGGSGDALGGIGGGGEYAAVIRRIPLAIAAGDGTAGGGGGGGDNKSGGDGEASSSSSPASVVEGLPPGSLAPEGYVPGQLTLVDLLYAPAVLGAEAEESSSSSLSSTAVTAAASALRSLARCLAAVEGLAHCLVWTSAPVDAASLGRGGGMLGVIAAATAAAAAAAAAATASAVTGKSATGTPGVVGIDRIELPRLGISFRATAAASASATSPASSSSSHSPGSPWGVKLECEEHAGLFLSARRSPALDALLVGLPHALLLEGRDGALSVLLPAGAAPRPALDRVVVSGRPGAQKELSLVAAEEAAAVGTKGFGTDMVLDRWDAAWTRNAAGGGGHYVYPVHSSHAVMRAPSLPAALYLTLLRFLARRYSDVCKLSDLCVSESHPTPEVGDGQQAELVFDP